VKIEAGAVGFLVVLVLCCATVGIFRMMSRSLKRMKSNVASGEFHGLEGRPPAEGEHAAVGVPAQEARSARGSDGPPGG
jgi:hypothetical protein